MPQFFIEQTTGPGEEIEISNKDAKHIAKVLRLQKGNQLILSTGDGNSYNAELVMVSAKSVKAKILSLRKNTQSQTPLVLAQAIIKHDRTEQIIQKAIELGVNTIIPFISARSIPQFTERLSAKKHERWNAIAHAAAKQSGLPVKPVVNMPINFAELTTQFANFTKVIMFWESANTVDLRKYFQTNKTAEKTLIIIGPEGGFDQSEASLALQNKATTVSLGSQILRVETAAITAIALCQYEMGNMDIS